MRLKILINDTNEEERALVNIDTKEVILRGDYYHDRIDERIDGFLYGLRYVGIKYNRLDNQHILPKQGMFKVCDFIDCSFDED